MAPVVCLGKWTSNCSGTIWIGDGYKRHNIQTAPQLDSPRTFFVILLALGPGLIVNSIFKEYWGRPRPRDIVQYGGKKEFLHPWQKGVAHNGSSFPSGHSSAAFYLTAPFFVLRRRKPRAANLWLAGGLIFGIFMSIARMVQGGHFLSDNLWAWGMVHLTAVALYYLLRLNRDEIPAAVP